MASSASPELEITQDGDKFQFKLQSLFHNRDFGFTVGETFEETMQNGVVMKASSFTSSSISIPNSIQL